MTTLEKTAVFLEEAQTYYLATVEGDQPRVRPFGTVLIWEGKLFLQTGKCKPVSRQLAQNPKAELCAFSGGQWVRVAGTLAEDPRREIKTAMLDKMPQLRGMYGEDDGNMQMLYFTQAEVTFSSFTAPPETAPLYE